VKFVVDETGMRQLLTGRQGPVVGWVTDTVRTGTNYAEVECPVDTGYLRAHHQYTVDVEGKEVVGTFGSAADYAEAVHEGRKISVRGPGRRGKGGRFISARIHGNPWLERALDRLGLVLKRGA
jgi:hypothetical protein